MPSLVEKLLRPERTPPAPVHVDLGPVLLVGTATWFVALVVTGVLAALGTTGWTPAVVCAAGVVIGVGGVVWARLHPTTPPAQTTTSENPPLP